VYVFIKLYYIKILLKFSTSYIFAENRG